jgi:hypothetical protein
MADTLESLEVQQREIAEKIKIERAIQSFLVVASMAAGHYLIVSDGEGYERPYLILNAVTCTWTYSDNTPSDLETEIRSAISEKGYYVSIRFNEDIY